MRICSAPILTLLGIVIGVASVVAMLAIGEGVQSGVIQRISAIGTNMLVLQPARAENQRRNLPSTLAFSDADAILEQRAERALRDARAAEQPDGALGQRRLLD